MPSLSDSSYRRTETTPCNRSLTCDNPLPSRVRPSKSSISMMKPEMIPQHSLSDEKRRTLCARRIKVFFALNWPCERPQMKGVSSMSSWSSGPEIISLDVLISGIVKLMRKGPRNSASTCKILGISCSHYLLMKCSAYFRWRNEFRLWLNLIFIIMYIFLRSHSYPETIIECHPMTPE